MTPSLTPTAQTKNPDIISDSSLSLPKLLSNPSANPDNSTLKTCPRSDYFSLTLRVKPLSWIIAVASNLFPLLPHLICSPPPPDQVSRSHSYIFRWKSHQELQLHLVRLLRGNLDGAVGERSLCSLSRRPGLPHNTVVHSREHMS